MEIERKFLINCIPDGYELFPHKEIEQAYLCTEPVLRIRKMIFEDESRTRKSVCKFTYKSKGLLSREEFETDLSLEAYDSLLKKCEGNIIQKTRYIIPYGKFIIELDIFHGDLAPLIMAEVEFESEEEANNFIPPHGFGDEVTLDPAYQNSYLSANLPKNLK